jgi:hypothetical protein
MSMKNDTGLRRLLRDQAGDSEVDHAIAGVRRFQQRTFGAARKNRYKRFDFFNKLCEPGWLLRSAHDVAGRPGAYVRGPDGVSLVDLLEAGVLVDHLARLSMAGPKDA